MICCMKLLVATRRTQGARDNDFFWGVPGELVMLGEVCRKDKDDPDGRCGCGRSFSGLGSDRAVTTAEIADLDVDDDDLVSAVAAALDRQGWGVEHAEAVAGEIRTIAESFPIGTVVGRRLDHVVSR
jgi:hypothetical protein